jgi:hypothetical protein
MERKGGVDKAVAGGELEIKSDERPKLGSGSGLFGLQSGLGKSDALYLKGKQQYLSVPSEAIPTA